MMTSADKPAWPDGYGDWLKKVHKAEVTDRLRNYYGSVVDKIKQDVLASRFWAELERQLPEFDGAYRIQTGFALLLGSSPTLLVKPFDSFLLKTFRRNVLDNANWPDAPEGGWWLPDNWYERVDDVVRTRIVVKYLDGVSFLSDKIRALADESGNACDIELQARQEGYYAYHVNVKQESEIPRPDWDTARVTTSMEIQITTQLQEVILALTHEGYEERRLRERPSAPLKSELTWQWDYRSEEFTANYLGHIIHYVEGMIMQVRDKRRRAAK